MSVATRAVLGVWAVLMLSTAASTWGFSQSRFDATLATVAVMLIAALKVALVMSHFMELRHAPRAWQLAGAVWVLAALSAVMILYLV